MAEPKKSPAGDRAARKKRGAQAPGAAPKQPGVVGVRLRSDARSERRYEAKPSWRALASVIAMSLGAVALGAGTYAQWFRGEAAGPSKYAVWLLVAGAAVLVLVALFGDRPVPTYVVGDAGVGRVKEGDEIERIGWFEMTGVLLVGDVLTFQSPGTALGVPIRAQPNAAGRALAEARRRRPKLTRDIDRELPLDKEAGEVVVLEPAQIAGQRCKASDKLVAFERDARLCGRCGELYYKDSVPKRCLTCDAALRS